MKIELTYAPTVRDIDTLTQNINAETEKMGSASPFGFFIRDANKKVIAGVNGYILYGSIYSDQLWVAQKFRKRHYATSLMERVHQLGREKGCSMATITTFSFQKVTGFYEKLGYSVDFERDGYVEGSRCLFLHKIL